MWNCTLFNELTKYDMLPLVLRLLLNMYSDRKLEEKKQVPLIYTS